MGHPPQPGRAGQRGVQSAAGQRWTGRDASWRSSRKAEAEGKGAASVDGKMIDAASERMARTVLEMADAIAAGRVTAGGADRVDVHEYQAKELLARYGVPIPRGGVVYSPEQATYRAKEFGGSAWVVKAQVHAGGRGEAGGVQVCTSDRQVKRGRERAVRAPPGDPPVRPEGQARLPAVRRGGVGHRAGDLLRHRHGPQQRAGDGRRVAPRRHGDRGARRVATPTTWSGSVSSRPWVSWSSRPASSRSRLDIPYALVAAGRARLPQRATEPSATSTPPWSRSTRCVITDNPHGDPELVALDAKMSFDDNALFRQLEVAELRDRSQEDARESHAADRGLAYIGLDGDIGCMINGAGLAMATLDMIKPRRRGARELPRHRGRRFAGARAEGVQSRAQRRERAGDAREHLRRYQPVRLGRPRCRGRVRRHRRRDPCGGAPRGHPRRRGAQDHRRVGSADPDGGHACRGGRAGRRRGLDERGSASDGHPA